MSQENVDVVRSIYERWNRNPAGITEAIASGNVEYEGFAVDLFDPAVEVRQVGTILDTAGTFHGHEGLLRSAKELLDAFESIEWAPERWTEEGEWLVVWVRVMGVGRSSGVETEAHAAQAWRVRGGRVTDLRVYQSEDEALKAAGLRE
jgi:ketosteroid isomerase-like protein